jgi:hypothetical protein
VEVALTAVEGTSLGLSALMDYLSSGNYTNVYNDPVTGKRKKSDWWPDFLKDPNKCSFPCTELPGISQKCDLDKKEGGCHLHIDFEWPLI